MNLKIKNDTMLLTELKDLVARERKILTEILHYLHEVESRNLHLERGYSSLHEFAIQELGYSGSAAHRRVQAMKLLKALPEMEEKIQTGELTLSNAVSLQSFFYQEERRKDVSTATKQAIAQSVLNASARECERRLVAISPESVLPKEKIRPISDERTLIQFTANDALMEKLEKLKGLLAHQCDGRMESLLEKLADMALNKLEPKPSKIPTSEKVSLPASRYIPRAIQREVWRRDGGCCTYKDPETGRVCGSRYALQLDHLLPYAWGGDHSTENLALRCRAHNLLRAKQMGLSA